ncbi:MAG TPA: hypothetical protein VNT26_02540 [Candidatus Sulfotelmatobacter sp.]|nr:hypothetical protein [Candidatus Sulfotelmatobacter sp.]
MQQPLHQGHRLFPFGFRLGQHQDRQSLQPGVVLVLHDRDHVRINGGYRRTGGGKAEQSEATMSPVEASAVGIRAGQNTAKDLRGHAFAPESLTQPGPVGVLVGLHAGERHAGRPGDGEVIPVQILEEHRHRRPGVGAHAAQFPHGVSPPELPARPGGVFLGLPLLGEAIPDQLAPRRASPVPGHLGSQVTEQGGEFGAVRAVDLVPAEARGR